MLAWYPGDNFRQVIPAWFAQHNYFPLPGCLDRCSLYLYHAEVELLRKKNRHNNVVRSTNPWVKIGAKTGLDKRALSLSRTSRFPFWENNISFSLARPIIKLATLGQGKQNWEQGKAGIHVFFREPRKERIYYTQLDTMVRFRAVRLSLGPLSRQGDYARPFFLAPFFRDCGQDDKRNTRGLSKFFKEFKEATGYMFLSWNSYCTQ